MKTAAFAILLILTAGMVFAQAVAQTKAAKVEVSTALKLAVVETKVFEDEPSGIFEGKSLCDANGAVYVKSPSSANHGGGMIVRLDPATAKSQRFDLARLPNFEGSTYAIGQEGEVYLMAFQLRGEQRPEPYLVTFSKDGTVKSKVKLESLFGTIHFAVFSSGDFLVLGRRAKKQVDGKSGSEDFNAIMDSSGKLVKYLELPDDEKIRKAIASGDSSYTNPALPSGSNRAVDLGSALTGPDGLVYILRRMSPVIIYAVDSSGQIVKRLEIASPQKGMMPSGFQVVEGRIAIRFHIPDSQDGHRLFKTFDWQTGEEISTFDADGLSSAFGCYSPLNRFALLSSERSKVAIQFAEPR